MTEGQQQDRQAYDFRGSTIAAVAIVVLFYPLTVALVLSQANPVRFR